MGPKRLPAFIISFYVIISTISGVQGINIKQVISNSTASFKILITANCFVLRTKHAVQVVKQALNFETIQLLRRTPVHCPQISRDRRRHQQIVPKYLHEIIIFYCQHDTTMAEMTLLLSCVRADRYFFKIARKYCRVTSWKH